MDQDWQYASIEAAEQELLKLKGTGRQLLEALADASNTTSISQQVANIISATEEALIKAETLTRQLAGAFDPDGLPKDRSRSRIDLIRKRKAELAGQSQAQLPRARQWDALEPSNMLQKVMERVYAVTGHAVYGVGADCCRVDAIKASSIRLDIRKVLTAIITLARPGQPEAVRVAVLSAAEVAAGHSHWKGSQHQVLRRVSDIAQHALRHFMETAQLCADDRTTDHPNHQAQHAEALHSLLLWLASYRDLYHLPCKATGQLLAMDQQSQQLLPPILRPFNVDPVNLELIAGGSVEAAAYHLHAFP